MTSPQTLVPKGQPVLISGTVTDLSPAQPDTPAISDDSMSSWMEYLNMQKTKPDNATGVEVHLTAIDSNGNSHDIGKITSDADGLFKTLWTPPVEGAYTVKASFEGSESYWSSSAECALGVGAASTPSVVTTAPTAASTTPPEAKTSPLAPMSPSPTQAEQPPTSAAPTATYIAIGVAVVVVVAAATALILRKRR